MSNIRLKEKLGIQMLLRICLILTIIAGLGTAYLAFFPVKDIITTTREARDQFHKQFDDETALYNKTHKELVATKEKLDKTTAELTQTKSDLDAANAKNTELDKQVADLTDKLTKMTAKADDLDARLEAYRLLPPPDQIKGIIADLEKTRTERDAITKENRLLAANVKELQRQLDNLIGNPDDVVMPAGLKGVVTAVDPKFGFVVLNIGDDQGAKERGVLMVENHGKLIGKVRISKVSKDTSVATIIPAWKRGEIMEGDEVMY